MVIPLHVEEVNVSKRSVEGRGVRVSIVTHKHEQVIDELLARERVEIERVPIGTRIDTFPQVREEGDLTIVPVVEEEIVVERRLVLKEEVRIRRIRESERFQDRVEVRRQEAMVTYLPDDTSIAGDEPAVGATGQT
ncbi:MAG TPA: DUF2382 domain-containing protein [Bryobacteraceae bacterium]|nr:DUF2382 domain-containing protein [Bryobacteraceae bacterium]